MQFYNVKETSFPNKFWMSGCCQDYVYVISDKRKIGIAFLPRIKCRLQASNRAFLVTRVRRVCRSEFLPTKILYGDRKINCPLGRTKLERLLCGII